MRIVLEFPAVWLVLLHELHCQCERARHVLIVRISVRIFAIDVAMRGAGLQHLRLQRNTNGDFVFLAHRRYTHLSRRIVVLTNPFLMTLGTRPGG
jgi:hypothetical protein